MTIKTINIIGTGRVGQTLGYLVHHQLGLQLGSLYSRNHDKALETSHWIGQGTPTSTLENLLPADCTFLTVCDDALLTTMEQLLATNHLQPGHIVVHFNGTWSAYHLNTPNAQDLAFACVHPIKSITEPKVDWQTFKGTYCAIEGDEQALKAITPLFQQLGANLFRVKSDKKPLYHAALVTGCAYVLSLLEAAFTMAEIAGINKADAKTIMAPLIRQTVDNALNLPPESALTGPIARDDVQTLQAHLTALKPHPNLHKLYQTLGQATLDLIPKSRKVAIRNRLHELFNLD